MQKYIWPSLVAVVFLAIIVVGLGMRMRVARPAFTQGYAPVVEKVTVAPYLPRSEANRDAPLLAQQGVPAPRMIARGAAPATQIARTGAISVLVGNVDKAIAIVSRMAKQQSGDVLSLDDKGRYAGGGAPIAEMRLRVPDTKFDSTLQALSGIGTIRSRSITAEDLTSEIIDSSARLKNLRRTEADIQKIMDRSGSVAQVLAAEEQLSSVREQIETLDADVKSMRNRVRYATITLNLTAESSASPSEPTIVAQLVSARRSAVHAFIQFTVGLAATLVWIVAFVPYLFLAALALWLVRRRFARAPW